MPIKPLSAQKIKAEALRLGFSACGVAQATTVDETASSAFTLWYSNGMAASMKYMGNYMDKRLDPHLLMEDTQSIVSVALNYYPAKTLQKNQYQFAWYAYGKDYHDVMKIKLEALQEYIATLATSDSSLLTHYNSSHITPSTSTAHPSPLPINHSPLKTRLFCDTAPILERYWAWRAGLGWIGKNTQLILPHAGSCFFLGEIFLDRKVDIYDQPQKSRCGNCTRCLYSCPTSALEAPFRLNSNRCLSYLTIEHREAIPATEARKMGNKIYGCDECQKACPWNRFASPCRTSEFQPSESFLKMQKEDWESLTEEQYRTLFKGSAVKRAKYAGLMRNIQEAKENK